MSTRSKCNYCDPPGSGHCKACQRVGGSGNARCVMCYGSGRCGYCIGTGLERSTLEKAKGILLGLWWVSWLGIIAGFLLVGVQEYRLSSAQGGASSRFSLALLIVTALLWVVFYVVDAKTPRWVGGARNDHVDLLTLAGTFLAIISLMGIWFFVYIAARIK
jgi:hypothetical protein